MALATLGGLRWSAALVAATLAGVALVRRLGARPTTFGSARPGAGAWVAAGVAAVVFVAGATGWTTQPDFYYHWGLKARRFLEIGGADYYFLAGPSAWRLHPDYPLLAPELFLLPSLPGGVWREGAALALSAATFALLLLALRRALREAGLGGARLEVVGAAAAALLGAFWIAYGLTGSAEPLVALALLLALPALMDSGKPEPARGWELGLAAALAAAAKLEGVPLALLVIGADALRRTVRTRALPPLAHLARTTLPTLVVALPWLLLARAYRLFLETNAGEWRWERAGEILPALAWSALHPDWALAPLALLALPLALRHPRLAAAAAVVLAQLALYLAVYFTGPVDTRFYVLSTFQRLLFHLLPATFVLVAARFAGAAQPFPRAPLPRESAS